jgi:hypothetical protein
MHVVLFKRLQAIKYTISDFISSLSYIKRNLVTSYLILRLKSKFCGNFHFSPWHTIDDIVYDIIVTSLWIYEFNTPHHDIALTSVNIIRIQKTFRHNLPNIIGVWQQLVFSVNVSIIYHTQNEWWWNPM